MLDLFWSIVSTLTGWLASVLPDSPITQWLSTIALQGDMITTGLGWLNWLVDINLMKIIMGIWLLAIAAYMAVTFTLAAGGSIKQIVSSYTEQFVLKHNDIWG